MSEEKRDTPVVKYAAYIGSTRDPFRPPDHVAINLARLIDARNAPESRWGDMSPEARKKFLLDKEALIRDYVKESLLKSETLKDFNIPEIEP